MCVSGDGTSAVTARCTSRPARPTAYAAGDGFAAFDTPVGRIGMLIDYDKTFPESARSLALDGAEILACLSAWPTSLTNRAPRMAQDRQARLFDLYDQARAAENQVVLASSNQTGVMGGMRFLGQAKVVGPGGDILARTWSKAGLAVAEVDVPAEIAQARRVLHHLAERKPAATGAVYRAAVVKIALLSYSTKPRGGVVHTLALAEALAAPRPAGHRVDPGPRRRHRFLPPRRPAGALAVVPFPDLPAGREEGVGDADPALDRLPARRLRPRPAGLRHRARPGLHQRQRRRPLHPHRAPSRAVHHARTRRLPRTRHRRALRARVRLGRGGARTARRAGVSAPR